MKAIAPYRWALGGYTALAAAFVINQRLTVLRVLDSRSIAVSFWDVPLTAASSGFLFTFLLAPLALSCALTQVRPRSSWENIARYPTRTDWVLAQVPLALPWIGAFTAATAAVAVAGGIGLSGGTGWGAASRSPSVTALMPVLRPTLPHPALALALQLAALAATLALLVLIVSATASSPSRPRSADVGGGALLAWILVSFPLGTGLVGPASTAVLALAPATYGSTPLAERALGLGPAGGLAVLLVGMPLTVLAVRRMERRRARGGAADGVALDTRAILAGSAAFVLAGLGAISIPPLQAVTDPLPPPLATIALLQGSGSASGSLMPVTGMVLLLALPALALHRGFVAALTERRFAEMVRFGSPGRWLRRHLRSAISAAAVYAGWCGSIAVLLLWAWVGLDVGALRLVGIWVLAAALQILVLVLSLVFGTTIARSATGGAVALGAALVLSWPLGNASTFSPFGQASLLRLARLDESAGTVNLVPILTLTAWILILAIITSFAFSRTRGEIE